ncbi:MAG TPA: NUDIX hydrolase [Myxococcaceae bacterium]|nr:NUDIX hydrolase [Myxococcaceae bacterium]
MESGRKQLLRLLEAFEPEDRKEKEDLLQMKQLAESLQNPLSRFQPAAHFTASAVVVDSTGERVCLVHHAKLGRWLQPGGHVEQTDGSSLAATALREAREETGCELRLHPNAARPFDLDVHPIPGRGQEPAHLHLDLRFLAVAEDPEEIRCNPAESNAAQWLSWEDALATVDEAPLRRMLEKARRICQGLPSPASGRSTRNTVNPGEH